MPVLASLQLVALRALAVAPLPVPTKERILSRVHRASDYLAASDAPLNQLGARHLHPALAQSCEDLEQQVLRGNPFSLSDLPALVDAAKNMNGVGINDRFFLLEKLVVIMSRLPDDSVISQKLQNFFIDILYKDLPHPPSGYLSLPSPVIAPPAAQGPGGVTYAFRSADGSDYSIITPWLGRAGTPYARSVPSTRALHPGSLPDAGLVFDTLLKRDNFVPHPGGISSLFFAFADLVIHSIFNTNPRDPTINDNSSYLDLSPLYGSSQAQVDSVRRKDGTGRLWDDVFADSRLLLMPPSVAALLVLFNRNHNYVADQILRINERGTFRAPGTLDDAKRATQDDELFARARLVNSAFFMQVILGDYVGAILGLVRDGLSWRLNPLETMRELDHEFSPQGEGNVVSLEFNLLYRWHATVSAADTEWLEGLFEKLMGKKDFDKLTVAEFRVALYKYALHPEGDVRTWTFDDLKRGEDGRYDDAALAKILLDATEQPASAFKARGTPEVMRVIEILGITQARQWGACSLNEFRKFMGLKPYTTFKEWNPDPKIHAAAESLYHHIDNLELHVGLQAEQAKPAMPGSGLCPGYTISRAILADAVCLSRGDRFLTVDFTPFNLTAWGYQDCQYDKTDGSYGGMLTKLLFRTLPRFYPAGSAYAHFPFVVPATMQGFLAALPESPVERYIWTRPAPPALNGAPSAAELYEGRLETVLGVVPARAPVQRAVFAGAEAPKWAELFGKLARSLLSEKAVEHVGSATRYVDVVRDVAALVPVRWLADYVVGLPLKTAANPSGVFREHEMVSMCEDVANYVFVHCSPLDDFALRSRAEAVADEIVGFVEGHLARVAGGAGSFFSPSGLMDTIMRTSRFGGSNEKNTALLKAVLAAGRGQSHAQLAAGLFAEVFATAALHASALVDVVDYLLDGDARARVVRAVRDGPEAHVLELVREAQRHAVPSGKAHANGDGANGHGASPSASDKLGDPALKHYGLMTTEFFEQTAVQVVRAIFALGDVQRAPGQSGHLNGFVDDIDGVERHFYSDERGRITPWPVSMVIQYNV